MIMPCTTWAKSVLPVAAGEAARGSEACGWLGRRWPVSVYGTGRPMAGRPACAGAGYSGSRDCCCSRFHAASEGARRWSSALDPSSSTRDSNFDAPSPALDDAVVGVSDRPASRSALACRYVLRTVSLRDLPWVGAPPVGRGSPQVLTAGAHQVHDVLWCSLQNAGSLTPVRPTATPLAGVRPGPGRPAAGAEAPPRTPGTREVALSTERLTSSPGPRIWDLMR